MRNRITTLLLAGVALIAVAAAGLHYLVERSRPPTNYEWRSEREKEWQNKLITDSRREMKAGIAAATDPRSRKILEHEYRIFEHTVKTGEIVSLLDLANGVDELEAFLIAKQYFDWQFGACGSVELPERKGDDWVVRIYLGLKARSEPPILIAARSGAIRCAGYPGIADAVGFVRGPKPVCEVYSLRFANEAGEELARGTVTLAETVPATGKIRGCYRVQLRPVAHHDQAADWLARLLGSKEAGELEWTVDPTSEGSPHRLNFMPGLADANILVWAQEFKAGSARGSWVYSTLAGGREGGAAELSKR
jgi:hypothetical protein